MQRTLCKSKIHRATITQADLNYVGSITLDRALMQAADILPYEQVHVVNINNGQRLVTYAIAGEANSGVVCLNGAAARTCSPGDLVIVMTYASYTEQELSTFEPKVVFVDTQNNIVRESNEETHGLCVL